MIGDRSLPPPVFGLVLVGGRSERMKKDKAVLEYDGKSQSARAYDLLAEHCENVFLSSRADQADLPGYVEFPQILDCCGKIGPTGGILSAQRTCPGAAWLVLACDLPFLDRKTLAHLILNRNPEKIATAFISMYDSLPEPLCTIWEPASENVLRESIEKDVLCPRKALINAQSRVELLAPLSPHALDNINTPDEFRKASKQPPSEE